MAELSEELVDRLAAIANALNDFLGAIREPQEPVSSDIAAQVAERVRRGVCLQCEKSLSQEKRVSRGLCYSCYSRSLYRVRQGQTTEAWLIANGFLLAEHAKGGRKVARPDPVGEILANRKQISDAATIVERDARALLEEGTELQKKLKRKRRQKKH